MIRINPHVAEKLLLSLVVAAALTLIGCDSTSTSESGDEIVVEAFLFAGEPVDDIRLTRVIALDAEDLSEVPVTDATITLFEGANAYELTQTTEPGRYAYSGAGLVVETGDTFRLEIVQGGQFISAETTVPEPPVQLELSHEVLGIPQITLGGGRGGFGGADRSRFENTLTMTWSNPLAEHHYVVIEDLIEGEPQYILPEFIRDRFEGFQFVTQPTTENFYDVRILDLEIYGRHRAILYRVNKEYANLYENREQDSRDLNEPPSNINGALGIFSAFSSVSADFDVVVSE